jgi:hypothetical protein
MIFVSINPFALKRFFFFLLAAIGLSCVSCFGQSILLGVKTTPYDKQMSRIRLVLIAETPEGENKVSLGTVNRWISDLRSIPYGFTKEWKTPTEINPARRQIVKPSRWPSMTECRFMAPRTSA